MKNTDPRVDAYIEKAAPFARPILERVRKAFHAGCPDIEETIKWGCPAFELNGMVGGMAAFKKHASFGFWKAAEMKDPEGLFGGEAKASFMGVKVTDVRELPTQMVLVAYVGEAVALNREKAKKPRGKAAAKPRAKETLDVPQELLDALAVDPAARATWDGFSYTHRKEYAEWVATAKRQQTRDRRLEQAVAWMAEGKPRNWKYRC
jgi:uncharacterized protein YdeI (YjbR/CyaY-like superfamily)